MSVRSSSSKVRLPGANSLNRFGGRLTSSAPSNCPDPNKWADIEPVDHFILGRPSTARLPRRKPRRPSVDYSEKVCEMMAGSRIAIVPNPISMAPFLSSVFKTGLRVYSAGARPIRSKDAQSLQAASGRPFAARHAGHAAPASGDRATQANDRFVRIAVTCGARLLQHRGTSASGGQSGRTVM